MAKKFFYVCGGILMLALSYHFGASSATAQAGSPVQGFAFAGGNFFVMTSNGDVYQSSTGGPGEFYGLAPAPTLLGNYWGGPVPTTRESWGAVKERFR